LALLRAPADNTGLTVRQASDRLLTHDRGRALADLACAITDVLPVGEPKALALTARLYDLAGPPAEAQFRELAEAWKPFRTWAVVLIRAAARRILDGPAPPS
jgi:hypothetical protein